MIHTPPHPPPESRSEETTCVKSFLRVNNQLLNLSCRDIWQGHQQYQNDVYWSRAPGWDIYFIWSYLEYWPSTVCLTKVLRWLTEAWRPWKIHQIPNASWSFYISTSSSLIFSASLSFHSSQWLPAQRHSCADILCPWIAWDARLPRKGRHVRQIYRYEAPDWNRLQEPPQWERATKSPKVISGVHTFHTYHTPQYFNYATCPALFLQMIILALRRCQQQMWQSLGTIQRVCSTSIEGWVFKLLHLH